MCADLFLLWADDRFFHDYKNVYTQFFEQDSGHAHHGIEAVGEKAMRRKTFWLVFAGVLVASLHTSHVYASDGPPKMDVDEQMLVEKYHIPATREGFLTALHHSSQDVRVFGAIKLAAEGDKDAIPAILEAVTTEPVPSTKSTLAYAAAMLGSEGGLNALTGMCHDPTLQRSFRMMAAQDMEYLGHDECVTDVLDCLRSAENNHSDDDISDLTQALYLIPWFKHLTPEQLKVLRPLAAEALRNHVPIVRAIAAYAFQKLGDPWAAEPLRIALAVESDDNARRAMQSALNAIEAK
jgi:HEAT repeat protein